MRTIGLFTVVACALTLVGVSRAEADCITGGKATPSIKRSLGPLGATGVIVLASDKERDSDSIVGLWAVTFYVGDGPDVWDRGFEQFHSDGTELTMDVAVPPAAGNICVGVWKSTGPRKVKLHHVGWNWDFSLTPPPGVAPGTLAGTFLLDMTLTASRDGKTFSGRYVTDSLDLDGNTLPAYHAEGVVHGTRITVD